MRPMTAAEFKPFRARLIRGYAASHVRAGDWSAEEAEDRAARETDDLLPAGPSTPGMLLFVAETADGTSLGMVWVALDRQQPGNAWIYNIEINPEHRGKGYGRLISQSWPRDTWVHAHHPGNTAASHARES